MPKSRKRPVKEPSQTKLKRDLAAVSSRLSMAKQEIRKANMVITFISNHLDKWPYRFVRFVLGSVLRRPDALAMRDALRVMKLRRVSKDQPR